MPKKLYKFGYIEKKISSQPLKTINFGYSGQNNQDECDRFTVCMTYKFYLISFTETRLTINKYRGVSEPASFSNYRCLFSNIVLSSSCKSFDMNRFERHQIN